MKLNLGAGRDIRPGWVNIDIRPLPGIDVVADVRRLPLADGVAEEIVASDVIEHIPPADIPLTVREWRRVLREGGRLFIRTPDFYRIFRVAVSRQLPPDVVFLLVFGDQSSEQGGPEFGGHRFGTTVEGWQALLSTAGFRNIVVRPHPEEFNFYISAVG